MPLQQRLCILTSYVKHYSKHGDVITLLVGVFTPQRLLDQLDPLANLIVSLLGVIRLTLLQLNAPMQNLCHGRTIHERKLAR